MFSGIITERGIVRARTQSWISLGANRTFLRRIKRGDSIAVDGVCLTIAAKKSRVFSADVVPETMIRTALGNLSHGACVNLELPATPISFLSGHIVQGHVDGVGVLTCIARSGNSRMLTFLIPRSLSKYIAEKGSIAVNGVSLTVVNATKNHFTVCIIPHTWENSSLRTMEVGAKVNIEVDVLAKYVYARQKAKGRKQKKNAL